MQWSVYPDGSFDLISSSINIRKCYPAIDGRAIHPLGIAIRPAPDGAKITYTLATGAMSLQLSRDSEGLCINIEIMGMSATPHRVHPLVGEIQSATRLFRQGQGLGGPTDFVALDKMDASEPVLSYVITALCDNADEMLILYAPDQRRFVQYCQLTPPLTHDKTHQLDVAFLTENIPMTDASLTLPSLYIRGSQNLETGLMDAARQVGQEMGARTHQPPTYHWCSWYYLYHNLTEVMLDDYVAAFAAIQPNLRLQTLQIDAGYFPSAGDWLETTPYWPSGLKAAFDKIAQAGFRPGIWIGPYMVGNRSRLYAEHPDWMLHDLEGRPITPWRQYNEPKPWGYQDEEYYVLDTSHPDAMEYMRVVFRTLRNQGATFFKTDFMRWGLQDSSKVKRHTPGKTSVEYMREFLHMIRKEIGTESFWLACIAPYSPFIGYADAMRIGGDVGASWEPGFGPLNMLRESVGTQYFNNIWWQNDPDAILLREFFIHLNDTEMQALALWQAILGGVTSTSAPLHLIAPERLDLWRFLRSTETLTARLPFLGQNRKLLTAIRPLMAKDTWALLAFNTDDEAQTEVIDMRELGVEAPLYVWAWGPRGAQELGMVEHVIPQLAPHAATLYYLSTQPTPPSPDLTLGGVE